MKRILMRAWMSPLESHSSADVICNNLIGNNIGNMLFPHSICRTLMTDDVEIDTIKLNREYTKHEIREFNSKYDCLIIPLANAFRVSFIDKLNLITEFVDQMKIPCIVIGVGVQLSADAISKNEKMNEAVIKFMNAVLKKSSMVGVRGEYTAEYLEKLGFVAEKDFTVIGCPSMYLYGNKLPEMDLKELTPNSKVSMNSKASLSRKFHDFMQESRELIPDYQYATQVIDEIKPMYIEKKGSENEESVLSGKFPTEFPEDVCKNGRITTFVNVNSWLGYLKEKDFSFGSRIHGNIASILAGTPSFILVSDARIKELADYHHIPYIMEKDLKKDSNIFDLYNKADFSRIYAGHEKRFAHYIDFLRENGLETIYDKDFEEIPFDKKIKQVVFEKPVRAFSSLSEEEKLERLRLWKAQKKINEQIRRLASESVAKKVMRRCVNYMTR